MGTPLHTKERHSRKSSPHKMGVAAYARQSCHAANSSPDAKLRQGRKTATARSRLRHAPSDDVSTSTTVKQARPMTEDERRYATKQTETLIKQRNEVDEALIREATRAVTNLQPSDWLPREDLLRRNITLAQRERKHIRARTKTLKEKEYFYKCDPSTARAVDRDLIESLLQKFKRHLATYLEDRERPYHPHDTSDDDGEDGFISCASFDFDSDENVEGGQEDSTARVASGETSEQGDLEAPDDKPDMQYTNVPNLDGCVHDWIREEERKIKRKRADGLPGNFNSEKEQCKKLKKAQDKNDNLRSRHSSPFLSPPTETESAPSKLANDRMPMPQKKIKADGTGSLSVSDPDPLAVVHGHVREQNRGGASPAEPWYKIHARAMMEPDFNDHVHYRQDKMRNRMSPREWWVSGALVGPDGYPQRVNGYSTPPTSSNASSTSTIAFGTNKHNGKKFGPSGRKQLQNLRKKPRSPSFRSR